MSNTAEVDLNLSHTLFRTARRLPRAVAVIERDLIELSYEQLADRSLRLASALIALGAGPGARVGLLAHNCAAYVELLYACWAAGACAVPINVRLHAREVAFILDDADVRVVFVTDGIDTVAIEAARSGATHFIDVDTPEYRKLLNSEPLLPAPDSPQAPAWLFYTSGTTGRPKGVVLTHGNLLAMALNYLADVDHATVGDHLLHAAPMSHGSGLYTIPNVAVGATQLIPATRAFDVAEIEHIIAYTPKVKFFAAPTMVMRLVDAWRGEREPTHLKSIIYGGGPMYVADCLRALECFGPRLVQIYGQGEAPMTITVLPAADHVDDHDGRRLDRLGSVGRAQAGVEVAALDSSDQPVAVGEVGEVCVRGDVVMAGYLNDSDATAAALAHGWLHTGDLGHFDDHGYLTLVDRSKDLIISGGSNIYPREVEEVLLKHPAVKEAAVIGERDDKWGESVVAVLVRREGHGPDEQELDLFCLEHIARFKRPKRYVFVDQLPRNATGKVLKRELRAQITPK
ncbi:MAG TPA: long-chain fatty acid--CoA ligase [Burkholderiaceae bacterium]|nr:long-chain fatty acid--CoA ligase [Burkholderiaceae bacterium]